MIKYLIVSLVFSHLGFWSGNLFLMAPFPYLCLLVPSHILHNRLTKWADEYEKINECQFGFQPIQPKKSTVDCIFLFHSIISNTLSRGEKLYCSFVDFRRAFDTVNRTYLWQKLIKANVSGKMVRCLQSMYENVKACVKYKHKLSPFSRHKLV